VLLAVTTDGVISRESLQEMGVEFIGCDGGESAGTRQGISFLVDETVIASVVFRLEHVQEMVDNLLVAEFLKAARALRSSHVMSAPFL
jgi:hypothetical protein